MARVTITINTDGAAFDTDGDGHYGEELARILRVIADDVGAADSSDHLADTVRGQYRDINGNARASLWLDG